MAVSLPAALRPRGDGGVVSGRVALAGGARTTVYVAVHPLASTELRVAVLRRSAPLAAWCAGRGVREAIVGGFFVRPGGAPLGELRTGGVARRHEPFTAPWDGVRACLHVEGGKPRIARRSELGPEPRGDLLQAGPMLVRDSAGLLADAGCHTALNLDGGGSTSLVSEGRLCNQPRAGLDRPEPGGRAVSTALLFQPRDRRLSSS